MIAQIKEVLWLVLFAPIQYPQMLWILIPVILAVVIMELYFYRYPREGIGYHRAMENSLFLLFLAAHLIYYVVNTNAGIAKYILLSLSIMGWIVVSYFDFFHNLPTNLLLNTSSKLWIVLWSYFTMILIYSNILAPINFLELGAFVVVVFLVIVTILFVRRLMQVFEPKAYEEIEEFLDKIEKDIEKAHKKSKSS